MIKGINRQVVEVRETGSECFEKILFFVRPEYVGMSEGKIRERAGMITKGAATPPPTKIRKNRLSEILKFSVAVLLGLLAGISISILMR